MWFDKCFDKLYIRNTKILKVNHEELLYQRAFFQNKEIGLKEKMIL